jgi:hypothetical protein
MSDPIPPAAAGQPPVDYIRANRDRWTRDALTEELIRRGHSPEAVASAWVVADATAHPAADAPQPRRARQTVLQLIAVLLALGALLLGEVTLLAASGGRPMMLLYLLLFPLQILFVTRWIVGRIGASGGLRRGEAAMTVGWLLVPVIALIALMGVCFGYGGAFGCVIQCA